MLQSPSEREREVIYPIPRAQPTDPTAWLYARKSRKLPLGETEADAVARRKESAVTCVFQEVLERALNGSKESIQDYLIYIIHVGLPDIRCWVCS